MDMNKKTWSALTLLSTLAFVSMPSYSTIIGFEGLTANSDSFANLGIKNTYFGHQWTASNSNQQPTEWGAAELLSDNVNAFAGSGYAWTFNGAQSMFIDFGTAQNVNGVMAAGQFAGSNASTLQMFGYDSSNNLIGSSGTLNLALGQWQFLSGGTLAGLAVSRLELRSDAPTKWFALDNLDINNVAQVPAPGTIALLGLGLIGFGLARRKKL